MREGWRKRGRGGGREGRVEEEMEGWRKRGRGRGRDGGVGKEREG